MERKSDKLALEQQFPSIIKSYQFIETLGVGAYGMVAMYYNQTDEQFYAIKLESAEAMQQSLLREKMFLQQLLEEDEERELPIPWIYDYGTTKNNQGKSFVYLVMDYYNFSLEEYYQLHILNGDDYDQYIHQLKEFIGKLLNCLVKFHSKNRIHRDIKAQNMRVGINSNFQDEESSEYQVYMIDFGTSLLSSQINTQRQNNDLIGSTITASKFIHQGLYYTQYDDLISALYTILFLIQEDNTFIQELIEFSNKDQSLANQEAVRQLKEQLNPAYFGLNIAKNIITLIKEIEIQVNDKRPLINTDYVDAQSLVTKIFKEEEIFIPKEITIKEKIK
ncbi:ck1 family protein kinase [Stylonychia lemnae]|uniref:Casein kinase I n=1 Tax=Stylonychia lemnae TaxID=5949 RepID=A0A078AF14_STYLE|nr:ck1 family protein kinase [Stylonychia lemnae]|eukprot:CDW80391.1 ck1 family protein kinase [Stylonychia lemnae]